MAAHSTAAYSTAGLTRRPAMVVPPARHPEADMRLLARGAAQLGILLPAELLEKFARYQTLLATWGDKINLTAVRAPSDVVVRHFLDSLALVRHLPFASALSAPTLVDVGSGAGFPGAVCALLRPDLQVTLIERVGKKAAFLLALRRELDLRCAVRAEDASQLTERFGLVVSRAALPLPRFLPLGARLLRAPGWVLAMVGAQQPVPPAPPGLRLQLDVTYDVGAGSHRLLAFAAGDPPP